MTDDRPPRDIAVEAIGGGDDIGRPPGGLAFKALVAASLNGNIVGSEAGRLTLAPKSCFWFVNRSAAEGRQAFRRSGPVR